GSVYRAVHDTTGEQVAVKIAHPDPGPATALKQEAEVYRTLNGVEGFPTLRWTDVENGRSVIALDLLGPDLKTLYRQCNNRFSLKTVILLAIQLLSRLQRIHGRGYVHRDIKPSNIVMGSSQDGRAGVVHVVDFGLSRSLIDRKTGRHVPLRCGRPLIGNVRYASIRTHRGIEQSYRDDLESLAYMLINFLRGNLPWSASVGATIPMRNQAIMMKKLMTPLHELCAGFPDEFLHLVLCARFLAFDECPDYVHWRRVFRSLYARQRLLYEKDAVFDWSEGSRVLQPVSRPVTPSPQCARRAKRVSKRQ
ncbi:kinase-like protein, partial [Fistulina hepatica ATCC 64428]